MRDDVADVVVRKERENDSTLGALEGMKTSGDVVPQALLFAYRMSEKSCVGCVVEGLMYGDDVSDVVVRRGSEKDCTLGGGYNDIVPP